MAWWYHYSSFGPGHQSHESDFFEMPDNATEEDAKDYIKEKLARYDDWEYGGVVISIWKVETLSQNFLNAKCEGIRRSIEAHKQTIIDLQRKLEKVSVCQGETLGEDVEGPDEEVMLALTGRIEESLLQMIHADGITVDDRTVSKWKRGESAPNPAIRDRVIACGERAEKWIVRSYYRNKETVQTDEEWAAGRRKIVDHHLKMIEDRRKWKEQQDSGVGYTRTLTV